MIDDTAELDLESAYEVLRGYMRYFQHSLVNEEIYSLQKGSR